MDAIHLVEDIMTEDEDAAAWLVDVERSRSEIVVEKTHIQSHNRKHASDSHKTRPEV